jgi:hypothetical protein
MEAMNTPPEIDATGAVIVRVSWVDALEEQFGSVPWWTVSALAHVVVLGLLSLMIVAQPVYEPTGGTKLYPRVDPEVEPDAEPRIRERFVKEPLVQSTEIEEQVLLSHEEAEEAEVETLNFEEAEERGARGNMDEIADSPQHDKGVVATFGIGGGRSGAFGNPWARGTRKDGVRNVGTPHGPPAGWDTVLNRALEWLARHQEPDGHWDGVKLEGKHTDAGITGLALLAFLGDGHTERTGRYQATVVRAVEWLIAHQDADGAIGRGYEGGLGYHHAISGLALAEAFAMGRLERTRAAAQKAVDYSGNKHQAEYAGWRYDARQDGDMSVTGWFVMQLKSAMIAGLRVDGRGFVGAMAFVDSCTKTDGNYAGLVAYQPDRPATSAMTSVGLVSRQFLGLKRTEPAVVGASEHLRQDLPKWGGDSTDFYYWYYGTIGMFQMGGGYWRAWNPAMIASLVPNQRGGAPSVDGSWDPVGRWADRGGRVFSTALGAMCMEVYFRHAPLYGSYGG